MRPIMTSRFFAPRASARCAVYGLVSLFTLSTIASTAVHAQTTAATKPADASARAAAPARPPIVERTEGSGPNGATMRCKDGSYPPTGALDSACDGKGGILVRFPLRRFPEASKTPRVIAAPTPPRAAADTATSAALLREPAMVNRAKEFLPAARTPDNATMQCTDGTFIVADTSSTRCATRGGVLVRFAPNPRRVPR
jgi:hypothetical protein